MFDRQQNPVITGVEDVSINLFIPGPGAEDSTNTGKIGIQLAQSNDKIKTVSFDLIARLEDDAEGITHLSNLLSMRDYLKNRILAEVLPE